MLQHCLRLVYLLVSSSVLHPATACTQAVSVHTFVAVEALQDSPHVLLQVSRHLVRGSELDTPEAKSMAGFCACGCGSAAMTLAPKLLP